MLLAPFLSRIRKRIWLWILVTIGATFGVLPDLLGAYGFLIARDNGQLYVSAHSGAISNVLRFIPMSALHLAVDYLAHDNGNGWHVRNGRLWVDIVMWLVNFVVIYWFVIIWKRNAAKGQS
jgi:hypothetical protein